MRESERIYQKILLRNQEDIIDTYQLNTVIFGLSAAPFLAIRCIKQLVDDESYNFPIAFEILKRDLYVDDFITGADTGQHSQLRDEVTKFLQRSGMNIRQ